MSEKLKEFPTAEEIDEMFKDPEFKKKFDESVKDFVKKMEEDKYAPRFQKNDCNCCCCKKY